jgi:hypothetical protein
MLEAMSSQVSTPQTLCAPSAGSSNSTASLKRLRCKTQWPKLGPCNSDDGNKKRAASTELLTTPVKKKNHCKQRKTMLKLAVDDRVVPVARKPFAIFVHEHSSRGRGLLSKESYKAAFKELAMTWKGLPENDKECYRQKARDEFAQRRVAAACNGIKIRIKATTTGLRCTPKGKLQEEEACPWSALFVDEEQDKNAIIASIGPFEISEGEPGEPFCQGSYGKRIMRGVHKVTGQPVALKIYNSTLISDYQAELKCLQFFSLKLHSTSQPLFPTLLGCYLKPLPCLCLEYGGVAVAKICPMSPQLAAQAAKQLRAGLLVMHSLGMIHTDVKPDNCVWMQASGQLKLIDFRMSVMVPCSEDTTILFDEYGTEQYRAPELWWSAGSKRSIVKVLKPAVDIFAYGCTVYEMVAAPGPRRLFNPMIQKGSSSSEPSSSTKCNAEGIYNAMTAWIESYATIIGNKKLTRRNKEDAHRLYARLVLAGDLRPLVQAACHPQPESRQFLDARCSM